MNTVSARPAMSGAVTGIAWMLISSALLASVAVLGRYAGLAGFLVFQIVFLRLFFAGVALSPVLLRRGRQMLTTEHKGLYAMRVVCGLTAMCLWFGALTYAPVGEVTAIGFLTPLLATLGAGIVFHERVGVTRWVTTFIGFIGALIIIRPGFSEVGLGTWLALCGALMMAVSALYIKALTDRDDPDKVVMISTLLQTAIMAVPAVFVWQPPTGLMWAVFVGLGTLGMLGHITLARALRATDASIVLPIEFARLPFAVAFGFMLFDELIDVWTMIGGCIIFFAAVFSAWRESRPDPELMQSSRERP